VTIDGRSGTLNGTVSRVGPVTTSSSSYSYPLIVALSSAPTETTDAVTGSTAQVSIDIAQADDTLVVPTSAVHTSSAGNSYVTVLQAGKQIRRTVKVGVVGNTYTQIISGLTAGTVVVLADPSQAVPSSSSNSTINLRGLGGSGGLPSGLPSGFPNFATRTGG
jgi:HlyD family secretion protein